MGTDTTAGRDVLAQIAPKGHLRAAINLGNAVLAGRDAAGHPSGITVDIAREFGRRLGLEVSLVPFEIAGAVVDSVGADVWDIAFLAIDPKRADVIDFTNPYVLIEGAFAIRAGAPFRSLADFDQPGVRIAVGRGAAYDLHLTRAMKQAELVRYASSAAALEGFLADGLEAGAGIHQPVEAFALTHPGIAVFPEPFMQIAQAMATPRGRDVAHAWVRAALADLQRSGAPANRRAWLRLSPRSRCEKAETGFRWNHDLNY